MDFEVVSSISKCTKSGIVYLVENDWDDWFTYSTLYIMNYIDKKGTNHNIGGVKIGQRGQNGRRPQLPVSFTELDDRFFSLGLSDDYYERLNKLSKKNDRREVILTSLNDISRNLDLFEEVVSFDVTQTSLLRDKTVSMIKGQYNRMAGGGARLTDYEFSYLPSIGSSDDESEKIIFTNRVAPKFKKLSSGHKVILLTVAKLVETVEEKTLVLLDEPEEHLHPPLVSAFTRALSNLLIYRNGVGIVATHSPVIVQEVPKKCVWILRRSGNELVVDRPQIETFGENLGILTSEIFGFEVTNSGFHKMLNDTVAKKSNYKSALRVFKGELGEEGKTMLRSLMYEKEEAGVDSDD